MPAASLVATSAIAAASAVASSDLVNLLSAITSSVTSSSMTAPTVFATAISLLSRLDGRLFIWCRRSMSSAAGSAACVAAATRLIADAMDPATN